MAEKFAVTGQGEYVFDPATNKSGWVTKGYNIRKFIGAGTAFETVGKAVSATEKNSFGQPKESLWATKEEAQAAADRANAGDNTGIAFATYSND